jgi:hypothetical protein
MVESSLFNELTAALYITLRSNTVRLFNFVFFGFLVLLCPVHVL